MPVKRGPWALIRGRDHASSANAMMEIAEDIRTDPDVTGIVVIVHRRDSPSRELEVSTSGLLKRSDAACVLALMRATNLFV